MPIDDTEIWRLRKELAETRLVLRMSYGKDEPLSLPDLARKVLTRVEVAETEVERQQKIKSTLKQIANDGCGLITRTKEGWNPPCDEIEPNQDEWCWSCVARVLLDKMRMGHD